MSLCFETIRVQHRRFHLLSYHSRRLNASRLDLLGISQNINLEKVLFLPDDLSDGLYRCRVSYAEVIEKVEFFLYQPKTFSRIKLVEVPDFQYYYKWEDRSVFARLLAQNPDADEVLITQNGFLTDVTYANVVLWDGTHWLTPHTCLLPGVMRSYLLDKQMIAKAEIKVEDLKSFSRIAFINAMRGLETAREIDEIIVL
jgi:4-amino-4-deoxychorismate lyase